MIFERAIMTTDTQPKRSCRSPFRSGANTLPSAASPRVSGMIHPNMATMLAFLTDPMPASHPAYLKKSLQDAAAISFNMISVDGDTSPSGHALNHGQRPGEKRAHYRQKRVWADIFQKALKPGLYFSWRKGLPGMAEGATKND